MRSLKRGLNNSNSKWLENGCRLGTMRHLCLEQTVLRRRGAMSIAMTLHLLGVIIWVGGMFFAHMILRPVLNKRLEPHDRLPLLVDVFSGFFPWVWAAVITILISGFWMLFTNYKADIGLWLVIMSLVGVVMSAIFMFIYFFPYRQLGVALKNSDKSKSVATVNLIRQLILVNLVLGLLVTVVAIIGKYGLLS